MRFALTSALKDLRRLRRDPATLLIWLGVPAFVAIILVVIFGRGDVRPHGKLLIVDEDKGLAATLLSGAFTQGPLSAMISVEKVDLTEGRSRIDKGDASALLIVPKGLTDAVLNAHPLKLQLIRNPAQRIMPEMIQEVLSMVVEGVFYLQTVAGPELRAVNQAGPPTDARISEISVSINHAITGLRRYLSPPVIELDSKVIEQKSDQPGGFGQIMLPGMLYMSIFFIAGGLASDIWRERASGALRRVVTTPASLGGFLAGKLIAVLVVLVLVTGFGLLLAQLLTGLQVSNFAIATFWVALSGVGLYLLMTLIQSLASTERTAHMLNNFILLPLTMLGGSFMPFDMMPQGLAQIGRYTPNGWSVVQLQNILRGSVNWMAFAVAGLFVVVAWFITGWKIRRSPC